MYIYIYIYIHIIPSLAAEAVARERERRSKAGRKPVDLRSELRQLTPLHIHLPRPTALLSGRSKSARAQCSKARGNEKEHTKYTR